MMSINFQNKIMQKSLISETILNPNLKKKLDGYKAIREIKRYQNNQLVRNLFHKVQVVLIMNQFYPIYKVFNYNKTQRASAKQTEKIGTIPTSDSNLRTKGIAKRFTGKNLPELKEHNQLLIREKVCFQNQFNHQI